MKSLVYENKFQYYIYYTILSCFIIIVSYSNQQPFCADGPSLRGNCLGS